MSTVEPVVQALLNLLSDAEALQSCCVQAYEPFNGDPNLTPWLGIYPTRFTMEPYRIGGGGSGMSENGIGDAWRKRLELSLYAQTADHRSASASLQALQTIQEAVFAALHANPSLNGTIAALSAIETRPYQRDLHTGSWLFADEIILQVVL